ncbi:MAG: geranylgeranylglycerol-phosphate geranylgeranyltransferase [Candidatus Eisenbacteria bacterium]|nr:geranylgeranylglycerol-phosphate geranylgeranyltransferase [Candidatus Eisenbacteria bacterium]
MNSFSVRRIAGLFAAMRILNSCAVFTATFVGGLLAAGGRMASGALGAIALAAASVAFLAAFGYALNDYYDVRADEVNRPSRPIPSGMLSRKAVLVVAILCALAGALFALGLRPAVQLALAGMCGLVWLYSARMKRSGLPGNILVSLLAGSTLVAGGLSVGHLKPVLFPAVLAFLSNLPREILKDVQDVKGDSLAGGRSVASARGERFALKLASVIMLVLVVVSFVPYWPRLYNRYYFTIVLPLDALLVWEAFSMWGLRSPRDPIEKRRIETVVRVLKFAMLAGLTAIGVGSL